MKSITTVLIIILCFIDHPAAGPPNRIWGRMEYQFQNRQNIFAEQTATGGTNQKQDHRFNGYAHVDWTGNSWLNIHSRFYSYWNRTQDNPFTFTILETYWDHAFQDQFLVRIGKQRVAWGSGYAWNPTDMLEPAKNPFRPQEERKGISAIKSDHLMGDYSLTLLAFYNNIFKRIELAVKLGVLLSTHELSLCIHQVPWRTPSIGFDYSGFISRFEFHGELALLNSDNLAYQPVSPEPADRNSYVLKALIGTMYTIKADGMLVLEYYRNRSQELYTSYFPAKPDFQNSSIMYLWRDTLFLMVMKREVLGIIDVQGMLFRHLNSAYFLVVPKIIITPLQTFSVEFMYHGLSEFNGRLSVRSDRSSEMIQVKASAFF
jgi:hypothetical protein